MNSRISFLLVLMSVLPPVLADSQDSRKPNIIVVYTDDHGYADLGCQGIREDVRTPHIDALAKRGVRMTDGYVTAPQCVPSRAGLLTGRYQNRFGLESNPQLQDADVMRRFDNELTIAERLKSAGYVTGMAGKWHLGAPQQIVRHGFDKVFFKHSNAPGHWNMNLAGEDIQPVAQKGGGYHLDLIADFTSTFINRYHDKPFFFYLAYRAPHVPLDAPPKYLNRFPGKMPERRRQALGMISAMDDGIGRIVATLESRKLLEDTLIFVISDNGAPLKIHKIDAPGGGPGWDGSLNTPLNGEKGMLTEGGIRTPFLVSWPGTIPEGKVFRQPVISLDVAATVCAIAGLPEDEKLDGINLLPLLEGAKAESPRSALYWRWLGQSAIRKGDWKYVASDEREYLFDMKSDREETSDLLKQHPEVANELRQDLKRWANTLSPPGIHALKSEGMSRAAEKYYSWYIDGEREEVVAPDTPRRARKNRPKPKP